MQGIQYTHGQPCWTELAANDPDLAKSFYAPLFDWDLVDIPLPDGAYTMYSVEGQNQGAMYGIRSNMDFVMPGWNIYFFVDDIEACLTMLQEAGGTVRVGVEQVGDAGKMAMVSDPEGASFCLWQAGNHKGAANFGELNSLCWIELACRQSDNAKAFYQKIFQWQTRLINTDKSSYIELSKENRTFGGILPMSQAWGDTPSHWMPYFQVKDCNTTAAKAKSLGGTICVPPTDIEGVGRFSVISDPQGAVLSVIALS